MKTKYQLLSVLLILVLVSLACGQIDIGIEENTPTPGPDVESDGPEPTDNIDFRDVPQKPNDSQYWVEVEDPRTGVRFAVPCYWTVNFPSPELDSTGKFSVSVANYTEQFVTSLGPKMNETIFEIGGLKFDLTYIRKDDFGLNQNASLDELAYALVNPDQEHGIDALIPVEVDGKAGVQVDSWSIFGKGRFYLLPYVDGLYVLVAPYPGSIADHPDIQAILNSFALSPESEVVLPNQRPAGPPKGMAVSCMPLEASEPVDEPAAGSESDAEVFTGPLECNSVTEDDALMWTVCNVRDSFISRNTQPLMGYMTDPFMIAYWQSEGASRSREEAFNEIVQTHLAETAGGEMFTTDRSQFPPLFGMLPENMFGPDDNPAAIVYSEGWGQNGEGAALLYFKQAPDGRYVFYAMVIAQGYFDK